MKTRPLIASIAVLLTAQVQAQTTWLVSPASNDWNTPANWDLGDVPNSNTEQAVFNASSITSINLPAAITIQKLTFGATAPAYTLGGSALTIDANTTAATADAIVVTAGAGSVVINNALVINDSNATGTNIAPSITAGTGATLTLNGAINSSTRNVPFAGNGVINVNGAITAGTGQIQHNGNATVNIFTNPVSTGQIRSFSNGGGGIRVATTMNKALGLGVTGSTSHVGRIFLTGNGIVSSGALSTGGGTGAGTHTMDVTFGTDIPGTGSATQSGSYTFTNLGAGVAGTNATIRLDVGADDTLNMTGAILGTAGGYTNPVFLKQGPGTAVLTGANTYTIPTQVAAGTLLVTPLQTGGGAMSVDDGGTLAVRLNSAGTTFNASALTVGTAAGATLSLNSQTLGTPTAAVINAPSFTTNGTTAINLLGSNFTSATGVPLIQYAGGIAGNGFAGLTLGTLPFRISGTLVDNSLASRVDLNLVVQTPKWNGNIAGGVWNIDDGTNTVGTLNWRTSSSLTATGYVQGVIGTDSVIFDDSALGTTTVDLVTTVSPTGIALNNNALSYTIGGEGKISGTNGISKNGTGTVILTNTTPHDYTGATLINAGTLRIGNGLTAGAGTLGAGTVVISSPGALIVNRPDDVSIGNAISGSGSITKEGVNNLTLSGAVTHTGATNLPGGTLTLSSGGAYVFGSALTGAGALVKSGATVTLTGDNAAAHTGTTTVSTGVLQVGTGAIGTPVGANGLSGSLGTGDVTLATGTTLGLNRNDTALVIPNTITGAGGLLVNGSFDSIVTLSGASTFTGGVNVNGGGIRVTQTAALGTGTKTVLLNNGTAGRPSLRLDGTGGDITIPASVSFQSSSDFVTSPAIVNEAGNNVIAGNFTLTAGGGSTRIRVDAGTLTLNGIFTPNTTLRALRLTGAGNGTVNGAIRDQNATNTLGVIKEDAGTWTLNGANTYSAATTISGGALITTTAQTGATPVTANPGTTFGVRRAAEFGGFSSPNLNLGNGGAATLQLDAASFGNPLSAPITATAFTVGSGSTLSLLGGNFSVGTFPAVGYTGVIGGAGFAGLSLITSPRVSATLVDNAGGSSVDISIATVNFPRWKGTLGSVWNIDDGSGTGTLNWREQTSGTDTRYRQNAPDTDSVLFDDTAAGTTTVDLSALLTPNGVTVNNSALAYTFSGAGMLSGFGGLTKQGTNTLTIANAGTNNYSGPTIIAAGTVQIGNGVTAGAGSLGAGAILNDGTLVLNRPDNFTIASAISGTGALIKQNANTVALTAVANYSGPITLTAGALDLSGGGNLTGQITGAGGLAVTKGVMEISGFDSNTYSGLTTIAGADLRLSKITGNAIGGNVLITGAGRLISLGSDQIADTATITFNGTSTDSTAGSTGSETVANVVVNAAVATGQFILRNTYNVTGTATVQNGVLSIASGATATIGSVNISGGTVRIAAGSLASSLTIGPGGVAASGGVIEVKFNNAAFDGFLTLEGNVTTTGNFAINTGNTGAAISQINLVGTRTFDIGAATTTTVAPDFGDGALIKAGAGTLALNGTLGLTGAFSLTANGGTTTIAESQTLSALVIADGATVTLNEDLTPAPALAAAFIEDTTLAGFDGGSQVAAVPEPGALALLGLGALGMLARRRRGR